MSVRVDLGKGAVLELSPDAAARIERQLLAALQDVTPLERIERVVLPDDHPLWQRHSGGKGHAGREWTNPDDARLADAYYGRVRGKALVFFDTLLDHPGQQLSVDDFISLEPDVFTSSRSIAGAINGLRLPHEASGRRYPFYWWEGTPTRYAVKTSVAELFNRARDALR